MYLLLCQENSCLSITMCALVILTDILINIY